jgi:hypothetical protein
MNENKYQNAKETAGLLGSLSFGLVLLIPLGCILLCLLIFVAAMFTGGNG